MLLTFKNKSSIPTESYWFRHAYQHPGWLTSDYTRVRLALHTATALQPKVVPDPLWLEGAIEEIIISILQTLLEKNDLRNAAAVMDSVQLTVGMMAERLAIEEALHLQATLQPIILAHAQQEKSDSVQSENQVEQLRFTLSSDIVGQNDTILRRRPDYLRCLYPSMLIEDVAYHIVPSSSHNTAFRVTLEPTEAKAEKLIAAALNRDDYHIDLASATRNFLAQCAQAVMAYGEASYELVYLSNPNDGAVVEFQLAYIQPLTVMRRRGQLVQYVPAEVARARKGPQYIPLRPDRIIMFPLPASVQKGFSAMMEGLAFLSNHKIPDFVFNVGDDGSRQPSFDASAHIQLEKQALAEAGKLIGWDARGLFREETLEFYDLYRALAFERFKIELRTSILDKVNEVLTLAGQKVGFFGQLQIKGLPILKEIEAAQAHLVAGDQPFLEILKPFRTY